ncbi:hypothetical protein BSKO_01368 [Bryopsis sp. KO-2023]|nr:hypothetical protein BSKO_01368 [Bryopsis sp. KO-2023]
MSGSYRLSVDEQHELQKRVSRDSRLSRLAQVREQAKRASAERLQKYRERLDVSKCTVEKQLKEKWEHERSTRLGTLSEKYCKGACEVGGGHSAASASVLKETTNRIQADRRAKTLEKKTSERFRAAIAVVKTENEARDKSLQDVLCRRREQLDVDRKKAQVFGERFKEEEETRKRREAATNESEEIRRQYGQYSLVDFRHTRVHQLGVPTISEKHELDDLEMGRNKAQEEAGAEELRLREIRQKQHTQAAENAVTAKNRGDVALMREKAIREREVIEQVLEQMQAEKQHKREEALKRGELVQAPLLREWQTRKHKQDLRVAFEQVFIDAGCGQETFIQEEEEASEMSMKDLYWSQGKGRRNGRPPIQNSTSAPDGERVRSPPPGARKHVGPGQQVSNEPCSGEELSENRAGLKQASRGDMNMRYQRSGDTPSGWFSEESSTMTADLDDDALEPRPPPTVCPIPYPVASSSASKGSKQNRTVSVASSSEFESESAVGREVLDSPGPSWLDDMLAPYLDKGDTLPSQDKQPGGGGVLRPHRVKEDIKEPSRREDDKRNSSEKEGISVQKIEPGAHIDNSHEPSEDSRTESCAEPSLGGMGLASTEESKSEKEQPRSSSPSLQRKSNINLDSVEGKSVEVETADAMSDALSQCTDNFIEEYLKEATTMEAASKPSRGATSSDTESLATGLNTVAGDNASHGGYRSLLSDLDLGSSMGDQETSDDGSVTSFDIDKLLAGLGTGGSSSIVSGLSTAIGEMERGGGPPTTSDSISISESIMNPILSRSSIVRTAYGLSDARIPSAPSSTVTGITALLDPIPEGSRYQAPELRELLPTASSSSQREAASDGLSALKSSNGAESRAKSVASPSSTASLEGLLGLLDSVDCGDSTPLNNDDLGSVCSTLLDTEAVMSSLSLDLASSTAPYNQTPIAVPQTPLSVSSLSLDLASSTPPYNRTPMAVPQTPLSVSTDATRIESYVSSPSRSVSSIDWPGVLHSTLNSSSCSAI